MDEIEIQEDDNQLDANAEPVETSASGSDFLSKTTHISGMYQNWFLDYASYVILERAVPHILDGLKPVQRRILHAMKELDDGRYNKVANIVGHTMQYHPHGDASIGDALVQMGQKELLIDCQGNWGNTLTGDNAAAPRYIEARLSKFALDVVFNPKTTKWQRSYDGRKKEPIALPVKFPLLLAQGTEGIAVGLACKIFPHNFLELIDASINILKDKPFEIFPDFLTGGLADCSRYNNGLRGGRIRVRARIKQIDKKTLAITEIPFGMTTDTLIESIVKANDSNKIKIRKIDDNTAAEVEIIIHLASNVSPDQTIDALYAFTNCEISIAPNACVIIDNKPIFMSVPDILRYNTAQAKDLLKRELEIRLKELEEDWHYSSLERIFFEHRIYKELEKDQDTWEEQLLSIEKAFDPFLKILKRPVTREDILRLTEKPVRRISKFDLKKADEHIKNVENEMQIVQHHLNHLTEYAIDYFLRIKKDYGKNRERRTELRNFDNIEATRVVVNNEKLYFDREEGFAGTSLKKAEYLCDCSDIDEAIIFLADGTYKITKVSPKFFVGTSVIHIAIFQRNDERTIYNAIYQDGKNGNNYVKRFAATGLIRDKEYNLTKGSKGSMIHYFTANPNGEAEVVRVLLRPKPKLRRTSFDFDFSDVVIKSRSSQGNIISKNPIKKVILKEDGISTLGAVNIYYDDTVRRLNGDERGRLLGAFKSDDKILTIMQSGEMKFYGYDLSSHFEEDMMIIEKFDPDDIITAVYYDGESKKIFIKRFTVDQPQLMKKISFISEAPNSKLILVTLTPCPQIELFFDEKKNKKSVENEIINVEDFIDVKSMKAKGKQLSKLEIKTVKELEPAPDSDEENDVETQDFELSETADTDDDVASQDFASSERTDFDNDIKAEDFEPLNPLKKTLEEAPKPESMPDIDLLKIQSVEKQEIAGDQPPQQEQAVKQNVDEIPFEIIAPKKKNPVKKRSDNNGQMTLF